MRVNVYAEELTDEVQVVEKTTEDDQVFIGVRILLKSSDYLHHTPQDDDRSAVTIWGSREKLKKVLAKLLLTLEEYEKVIKR